MLDESLKQTLAELAVCAPGPVPVDFLQHLTGQGDLADSLETLVRYSWCKQICVDDVQYYELHQLVRELIQDKLVGDELQERHIATVQHLFIDEPAHFLEMERWLGQADFILPVFKERKDRRLVDWAASMFGQFCDNRGHCERFIKICEWVIECFNEDKETVAMTLGHQALILETRGQLDEAMTLHQKEEAIYEALGDRAGLSRSYGNQALILRARGLLDEAMALLQKQEAICEALGDRASLSKNHWNQGILHNELGEIVTQKMQWQKSIAINRSMGISTAEYEKALADLEERLKEEGGHRPE
ncbi:MAG: tetratricopeptide repeat protein [Psychrosphaera sp.]|nr:tetratricopeptide repeat protein [Psychrosphaera sp.]